MHVCVCIKRANMCQLGPDTQEVLSIYRLFSPCINLIFSDWLTLTLQNHLEHLCLSSVFSRILQMQITRALNQS